MAQLTLKEIKEQLSDSEIIRLLKSLGAKRMTQNTDPNAIIFSTVCHHTLEKKRKFKLYYYKNSRLFYCYSRCGLIGDVYELVGHVLDLDRSSAIKYALKFFNIRISLGSFTEEDLNFDFGFDKKDDEELICHSVKLEDMEVEHLEPIQRQNIMRTFITHYCAEWLNDGISKESMDKFNIKFSLENTGIVIPHYSIDNKIIGIRIRNLNKDSVENFGKYTPLRIYNKMYNHKLGQNLYGLSHNKEAIQKFKKVIIFEGEKSVLLMDTFFGDNSIAVAICGANMSRIQMKMLIDLGVEEVIFALDKQYENKEQEEKWSNKVNRFAQPLIEYGVKVSKIWDDLEDGLLDYKDSPLDKDKDVYNTLVKNRVSLNLREETTNNV